VETIGPILFFLFLAAVVVGLVVWSNRIAEARRQAIAAWGTTHGLSFSRARDPEMQARYPFDCFREGSNRYAENVCEGRVGEYFVRAFDYHYETKSTDSKGRTQTHHHLFSAVVVETQFPLKPLSIRTEHLGDKLVGLFGVEDVDFELAEFNREFWVKSPDRRWAFDVLHQESMEFLLGAPRFHLEMQGHWMVARDGTRFEPPREFESALQVATGLLSRLPVSVVRELREIEASGAARHESPRET
jgi:hypothetical protein